MHLIKPCPHCGRRLRFPIDRGIIRVTCPCGHSFTADPDDTGIYRNASFDLSRPHVNSSFRELFGRLRDLDVTTLTRRLITAFLEFTYRIRNFPLLPFPERRRLIVTILIAASLLAAMIIALFALLKRPVTPDAMVI